MHEFILKYDFKTTDNIGGNGTITIKSDFDVQEAIRKVKQVVQGALAEEGYTVKIEDIKI